MRIGLLTTSFPRWPGDYAGSFVGDRARALADCGHEVEVLAADDGTTAARAGEAAIAVTRLPAGFGGCASLFYGAGAPETLERGGAAAYLAAARYAAELAAAVRARVAGWDAIESHWLVPAALAALAAAPGTPARAYAHSGDVALLERLPLGRAIAARLARGGVDLRFVTASLRDRFAALAGASVGTVEPLAPPGALFARRSAVPDPVLRRGLGLGPSPTLLAVGRLVPIKGHARLIRACARVRAGGIGRPGRDLDVVILGDGPERDPLRRLAREAGVPLRLPGFVPRPEVARWLAAADAYVQPSVELANGRTEGAPLATAEARAVGIPVIVESHLGRLADAIRVVTAV